MKHVVTLYEVETLTMATVIVAIHEKGDYKELQMVLHEGKVSFTVRCFHGVIPVASSNHACLSEAVNAYNEM